VRLIVYLSRNRLLPRILRDLHVVCVASLLTFEWLKQSLWKFAMYLMVLVPISAACFIDPSSQYVYLPVAARQRLGKRVTAATIYTQQLMNCWSRRFLCVPCRMK
jgi:hypothetical protein